MDNGQFMEHGQCPKCNETTIYAKNDGITFGVNNLNINGRPTSYISFICTSCGYFENYVNDPKKLEEIASTWQKIPIGVH
jgi:predicted nucleic-acid-binding Zn-ribbon protein